MSSPGPGKRRIDTDVLQLIEGKHEVTLLNGLKEFLVKFCGPAGTSYEGGVWNVQVLLPENYPFKSPSIGFTNRIFHPNIDHKSGTVCMDVLNQKWTPLYNLQTIFEMFLPQLLTYPNPVDPLNMKAAMLFLTRPQDYEAKVAKYVKQFATEQVAEDAENASSDSDSEISEISTFSENEIDALDI